MLARSILLPLLLSIAAVPVRGQAGAHPSTELRTDSGRIIISLLGREVGEERFLWNRAPGFSTLDANVDFTDRGGRIQLASQLSTDREGRPSHFEARGRSYRFVNVDVSVTRDGALARVENLGSRATIALAEPYFFSRGYPPLSARAPLIAYWERAGRPARINAVPDSSPNGIRIRYRGTDQVKDGDRVVSLRRYTVDGVVWGQESVWLDDRGLVAALLTRVHLLPLEAVAERWRSALPQLWRRGVADAVADQVTWRQQAPRVAAGSYALIGARLFDGTGSDPVDDATVVVRQGRIVAVGPSATTHLPAGLKRLDARGTTIVPGLWDMHAHASQIEWGPAYLAAGVTSIRDMGGDTLLLLRLRDAQAARRSLAPRMVLAGLVDGDTSDAFGSIVAGTPEQGRAIVAGYASRGFRQIKLYSVLRPDVVAAIARAAHEHHLTVTGHVPRALTPEQAVDSGMDQIAHIPLRADPSNPATLRAIQHLGSRRTVIDPTLSWNELLGRAAAIEIGSFEPMFARAPAPLAANYLSVRNPPAPAGAVEAQRMIITQLRDAGVRLVAGTDGGIPGASLLRELELLVSNGLTPREALLAATSEAARAVGLDEEVGTIQPGRRADMLVLDADPLSNISNVRRSRWVISDGDVFRTTDLWPRAGFTR